MTENFSNIKDILKGVQFRTVNPLFGKLISNWDDIVGKKFAGKSEIADIYPKGNKVLIAVYVASSPLVQELTFFKKTLLRKIKENYGLEVEDIIIKASTSYKRKAETVKQNLVQEVFDERPSEEELEKIVLDEDALVPIKASVDKQSTLTAEQKERMLEVVIRDLKTQEWMKKKGFPVCEKCGRVMTRKYFAEKNICHICQSQ